jgi:spore germination protein GerM
MAEKKNKSKASLGCLFWIAFILLIIVLFFFNKSNISKALESSGANDLFSNGKKGTELNGNSAEPVVPQINTKDDLVVIQEGGDGSETPEAPKTTVTTEKAPTTKTEPKTVAKTTVEKTTSTPTAKTAPATKTATTNKTAPATTTAKQTTPATRSATIFLVVIDPDGKVTRKEVKRDVAKTDSPLSEALASLFAGTKESESAKGYRSLIPEGTRLLSAIVKDGVATINVSEEFQFNQYGIEGYLGQLAQVVFTATSFSTVKSVQFLVEGQRREYLGAEGVWIGTPLTRNSFQ